MDMDDLLQSALMKHRDGDTTAARALYSQVIEADRDNTTARLNLASILIDDGAAEQAAAQLKAVLADEPANGVAHLLLSRACFLSGDHEGGYASVRAAFEKIPEEAGVAAEFVSAMRRQYFTFNQDEYLQLFDQAQQGTLAPENFQRLMHLTFLRIARPELIRLLVQPGLPQDTDDAVTRWLTELPEDAQRELAVLARNFAQAVVLVFQTGMFEAQRATLTLRTLPDEPGPETLTVEALEDCDTLTGATLEVVTADGLKFIPFSRIRSIEFDAPSAATGVFVTMRDGEVLSGMMPLFYLFTEFAESDKVRQGQSTLIRPVLAEAAIGVGLRALRADGNPLPVVRIEKIEFQELEPPA